MTPEVLGPYVIYERLGAGGMATVHRAEQIGLAGFRKQIALKRLLPHIASDREMVKMFTHEARLASHLRHANVVQIYDLGKHEETYFIAMEYVAGPTLMQIMRQVTAAAKTMPVAIALSILAQICDALDHAHNLADDSGTPLGIIHRDVSPANIIVSTTGVAKLIDFGIAKAASADVETQAGYIKGKYAYIAPEYTLGHLDLRADLFGLGVIAHELLTTRRLFDAASDFETIRRLREMPIQPPSRWNPQISADVDDIVLTALQRDPALRWQSASAMRTAIHNAARSSGALVTSQQVADWVDGCFEKKMPARVSSTAIDSLDELSTGTLELTTHQRIELDALGAVTEASQGEIPEIDDGDDDLIEVPIKLPVRAPRTSAHIIRRDGEKPSPAIKVHSVRASPSAVTRVVEPIPAPVSAPRPAHAIALQLTQTQAGRALDAHRAEDARVALEQERADLARARFPIDEDSGVVVSAPDPESQREVPTLKQRTARRWPWVVLIAMLVLAAGAAWYLYFIEGLVPDLG